MTESPLAEADPKSIDELFDADPLTLTQPDLDAMVQHYREHRAAWAKEDADAGAKGRRKKPSRYKEKPAGGLKLEDLGIDLGELGE